MLTTLYHSPCTGNSNWTNGPAVFPHYIVLRKVITGRQVVSGPLARSAGRAGELISQVFMRLAGSTDPAAVLTWETGIWTAECDSLRFFQRRGCLIWYVAMTKKKKEPCWNSVSYLPAFSSSHYAHRGRCTARWAPLPLASEWVHCSDSDSLPIHPPACNRSGRQSAGSWRCCIGPCRPLGNQTSLLSHCPAERKGLKGGWEETKNGKESDKMSGKEEIKAKQSQTIIPLMCHWCLLKAVVRTETITHGQLSFRSPDQTVKDIIIGFSLLKTSQLQMYWLRGYKCLVCLVMSGVSMASHPSLRSHRDKNSIKLYFYSKIRSEKVYYQMHH